MASTTDGEKIRRLRKAKGWNAKTLALKAGVNESTVWNAEAGKGLNVASLEYIAGALGVKIEDILAASSNRTNVQIIVNIQFDEYNKRQAETVGTILELLKKLLPDGGDMEIKDVKPSNSIEVTVEMDRDDIPALFEELKRLVGTEDFPIIGYSYEGGESPQSTPPDSEKSKKKVSLQPISVILFGKGGSLPVRR